MPQDNTLIGPQPGQPNLPPDEGGSVINENKHPKMADVNSATATIDSAGNAKDATVIGPRNEPGVDSLDSYDPTATTP